MALILPLVFIPLGWSGLVMGILLGLLVDQILLMAFVSASIKSLVSGSGSRWSNINAGPLDKQAIIETAILVLSADRAANPFLNFAEIQGWLNRHAKHWRLFYPYHSRICHQLASLKAEMDIKNLVKIRRISLDSARDNSLFALAVRLVSSGNPGIEPVGLDFLIRLAVALNLDNADFEILLAGNYAANQSAFDLFAGNFGLVNKGIERNQLLLALKTNLEKQAANVELVSALRLGYGVIEDQIDLIERAISAYRNTQVC